MTTHDAVPEEEVDVDPAADDDGRIGRRFESAVGPAAMTLLAHPAMWDEPDAGLLDGLLDEPSQPEPAIEPAAEQVDPPRGRRLRPAAIGGVAAIAVLFGGIVLLSALSGTARQPDFRADLVPTGLVEGAAGIIEVTSGSSGVEIDLDAPELPRRAGDRYYQGWLLLDDGALVSAGTFLEGADVTLFAGVERRRVVEMTITLEDLGADVPSGPSGRVVLKVDFPVE